jgi:hypothetical protein
LHDEERGTAWFGKGNAGMSMTAMNDPERRDTIKKYNWSSLDTVLWRIDIVVVASVGDIFGLLFFLIHKTPL